MDTMKEKRPYRPNHISIKIGKRIKWIKKNTHLSTNQNIADYLKEHYSIKISEKTICGWTNNFFTIGKKIIPLVEEMLTTTEEEYKEKVKKQNKIQARIESLSITF